MLKEEAADKALDEEAAAAEQEQKKKDDAEAKKKAEADKKKEEEDKKKADEEKKKAAGVPSLIRRLTPLNINRVRYTQGWLFINIWNFNISDLYYISIVKFGVPWGELRLC